jgi:hypothetical protein
MERSNAEAIQALGRVPVSTLGFVGAEESELARAGAGLPVASWLGGDATSPPE